MGADEDTTVLVQGDNQEQALPGAVALQSLREPTGAVECDRPIYVEVSSYLLYRQVGATTVRLSNVAHIRNGWAVQQNVVRDEGRRSVLLTISKNGDASTQH